MASTIASPMPRSQPPNRSLPKDIASLHPPEGGRDTPLPQYEKTQSVPFTLTLQEEKENPGQFQLVVNIDPKHPKAPNGSPPKPAASKKLIANLKEVPSLGFDVSHLYQTLKSSPPSSPKEEERQGWSDLDAIPPEFLQKVVPDWKVTFSRSDSTASSQSKKLADIKARIKKSGKGFVVRLLKGSTSDNDEVVDVPLGQGVTSAETEATFHELDSTASRAELDGTDSSATLSPPTNRESSGTQEVFEIGTSSEAGIQQTRPSPTALRDSTVSNWLQQTNIGRFSLSEEGFTSDAETLLADVRSIGDRLEDATDIEPVSRYSSVLPTRTSSVLSIVKTPTRGLSVVGPVRRIEKNSRVRAKGKNVRSDLNRSGANKSVSRRSPRSSSFEVPTVAALDNNIARPTAFRDTALLSPPKHTESSDDSDTTANQRQHQTRSSHSQGHKAKRRSSAEEVNQTTKSKSRLRLETNVPRPVSANTSPVTRRRRSPRTQKPASMSSSVSFANRSQQDEASPIWAEVDESEEVRAARIHDALTKAFGRAAVGATAEAVEEPRSIPKIETPMADQIAGDFEVPPECEIRTHQSSGGSPLTTFWGMALTALSEKAFEGIKAIRDIYGSERPVPPNHVRVRWTCSCGEALYDDFIEQKAGAARWLEQFLNRPRTHTPSSPSNSRSSTATSMNSVFDSNSRASTLATPASTYGGAFSWNKNDGRSKYNPARAQSDNPSYIRMADESWLLTCANEGRFTPKIVHLDVNEGRIKCDKDLALVLRDHYERLNRRWFSWARLRGLSTIEFVQFEVHRNRFADIRATPSMPPVSSSVNEKAPSQHPYTFEPVDLVPPVGSAYLLHLFKHPEDYDGEQITYLRSPKRRARLETGMGWGINLVEGFLAQKVWAVIMAFFGIGSGVFAILWTIKQGDVQGAFGVAGWVVTLAGLVLGSLQAWLD